MHNFMISVVIPSYNAAEYINDTLSSVFQQTYKNFEVLVVDDCSTDRTMEVLKSCTDPRLRVVQLSQNNGGPAKPRNVGVALSNGHFIAFCDADDIWHCDKLKHQVEALSLFECEIICSERKSFQNGEFIDTRGGLPTISYSKLKFDDFMFVNPMPLSSVLIQRTLLHSLPFNELKKFNAVEDYELWIRMLKTRWALKIDAPLLFYRVHDGGISNSKLRHSGKVFRVFKHHFGHSMGSYHFMRYAITHLFRRVFSL